MTWSDVELRIGWFYETGRGVLQDYGRAVEWYLKAAEDQHEGAQFHIGALYEGGCGVPQDYTKALEWYLKAAEMDIL